MFNLNYAIRSNNSLILST